MAGRLTLFTARWVVVDSERVLEHAGLLVRQGCVVEVAPSPRRAAARAARRIDLGEAALGPGLVNAHAHLELTDLLGRVSPEQGFVDWVTSLVAARRELGDGALEAAAWRGAELLLASGCTTVGDVDTTGAAARALARHPLRAVVYRELLDLSDRARRRAVLSAAGMSTGQRRRLSPGFSPHSPYTVSAELFSAVGRRVARRPAPVAVHWAETVEEGDWLEGGTGPLASLLGASPGRPGLDLIEAAGLLGPGLALVHGNDPRRDEVARIAAAGASVVHCPGSHAFFDRPPFALETYRRAGVSLALGTDSLASNQALDLRREMALARAAWPGLDPRRVWRWATEGGARALGLAGRIGALRPGMQADLVAWSTSARRSDELWDQLTAAAPAVLGVWIGGRRAVRGAGSRRGAPRRPTG